MRRTVKPQRAMASGHEAERAGGAYFSPFTSVLLFKVRPSPAAFTSTRLLSANSRVILSPSILPAVIWFSSPPFGPTLPVISELADAGRSTSGSGGSIRPSKLALAPGLGVRYHILSM